MTTTPRVFILLPVGVMMMMMTILYHLQVFRGGSGVVAAFSLQQQSRPWRPRTAQQHNHNNHHHLNVRAYISCGGSAGRWARTTRMGPPMCATPLKNSELTQLMEQISVLMVQSTEQSKELKEFEGKVTDQIKDLSKETKDQIKELGSKMEDSNVKRDAKIDSSAVNYDAKIDKLDAKIETSMVELKTSIVFVPITTAAIASIALFLSNILPQTDLDPNLYVSLIQNVTGLVVALVFFGWACNVVYQVKK